MIVPAGGLSSCRKFVTGGNRFFIPVKVMAKKFRGKFLFRLKELKNSFTGISSSDWQLLINSLYKKDWYAYCKRPFKSPEHVLNYLSKYTHRVAISNQRILSMENGCVSFLYRDYKDGNKSKVMTLPVNEFLRRFLLHVLPSGFRKIRYFGFLAPAAKTTKLRLCMKLLGVAVNSVVPEKSSVRDMMLRLTGKDIHICPVCSGGKLLFTSGLHPPS